MTILTDPAFASCIYSYLKADDLFSLRLVNKELKECLDRLFDRRYSRDFPFDTLPLQGYGVVRYGRRCKAKLKRAKINNIPIEQGLTPECGEWMPGPIVDFSYFCLSAQVLPEGAYAEAHGTAVRSLDGGIFLRRSWEQLSDVIIGADTFSVDQLRICSAPHTSYLRGRDRQFGLAEFNLSNEYIQDENYNSLPTYHAMSNVPSGNIESATASKLRGPDEDVVTRLVTRSPLEIYEDNCRNNLLFNGPYSDMDNIIKVLAATAAAPLDVLYCDFEDRIGAASVGDKLYVYGERQEGVRNSGFSPRMYTVDSHIEKISAFTPFSSYGTILALCANGELFTVEVRSSRTADEDFSDIQFFGVADLVKEIVLMKDGTVKVFNKRDHIWANVGENACMISEHLYLRA